MLELSQQFCGQERRLLLNTTLLLLIFSILKPIFLDCPSCDLVVLNHNAIAYRYGFNGKETDAESDLQDYGMRIYNARLGKFLSVDPLTAKYAMLSPYPFAENSPIENVDLDGGEKMDFMTHMAIGSSSPVLCYGVFSYALDWLSDNTVGEMDRGMTKMYLGGYDKVAPKEIVPNNIRTIVNNQYIARGTQEYWNGVVNFETTIEMFAAPIAIYDAFSLAGLVGNRGQFAYRTLSSNEYNILVRNKQLPSGWSNETFISRSPSYSNKYLGKPNYHVLLELELNEGTYEKLQKIGAKDYSKGTQMLDMPSISKGWMERGQTFFKYEEGGGVNIGLGNGNGLQLFNDNLKSYRVVNTKLFGLNSGVHSSPLIGMGTTTIKINR
ncbi:hypothetical protein BH09BAC5_BH09BAC5_08850 [soil metagenome]